MQAQPASVAPDVPLRVRQVLTPELRARVALPEPQLQVSVAEPPLVFLIFQEPVRVFRRELCCQIALIRKV